MWLLHNVQNSIGSDVEFGRAALKALLILSSRIGEGTVIKFLNEIFILYCIDFEKLNEDEMVGRKSVSCSFLNIFMI